MEVEKQEKDRRWVEWTQGWEERGRKEKKGMVERKRGSEGGIHVYSRSSDLNVIVFSCPPSLIRPSC